MTIRNRLLVFDLTSQTPQPIEDHEALDQLLDPQLFVEFGIQIALVNERTAVIKENKTYQITFGGDKYGL